MSLLLSNVEQFLKQNVFKRKFLEHFMTSRGRKSKKKNDSKVKFKEENEKCVTDKTNIVKTNKGCFNIYFSSDDITELKAILKTKDLSGIPFVVGATILNKLELIKKLLKQGYNINDTGQNNTSALIWAVKYKYLDIVDFLLSKGADPTIKTESGDNVLIVALEHKLWDELSFIKLWKAVHALSFVDVNFCGKNGHTMLHMAIRRDWETFIEILLNEKPNVNAANVNGITPLMLACFRNNLNIVNMLLKNDALVMKEDTHKRMALCYAVTTVNKNSKPPYTIAENILQEVKAQSLFKHYLKTRLEIIISISEKNEIPYATAEMLINIIHFTVQYSGEGVKVLMGFGVFREIEKTMEKCCDNFESTKFLLGILTEMLFYNEQSLEFSPEVQNNMLRTFSCSNIPNICLKLIKSGEDIISKMAFHLILMTATTNEYSKQWLKENYPIVAPFCDFFLSDATNIFSDFSEDRVKIIKRKVKKLRRIMNALENAALTENTAVLGSPLQESVNDKPLTSTSSKKTKRRSKALKARIAKIKVAELSERVTVHSKKPIVEQRYNERNNNNNNNLQTSCEVNNKIKLDVQENCVQIQKSTTIDNVNNIRELYLLHEEEQTICNSFQNLLIPECEKVIRDKKIITVNIPEWKWKILNLPFDDSEKYTESMSVDKDKLSEAFLILKNITITTRKCNTKNINSALNIIIDYFNELLQMIVTRYQLHWEDDEKLEYNYLSQDVEKEKDSDLLEYQKLYIEDLQKKFNQFITALRNLPSKNVAECYKCVCKLEASLLNHEIRGKSLLTTVSSFSKIEIKHASTTSQNTSIQPMTLANNGDFLVKYMEGVLNDHIEPRDDIRIQLLDNVNDPNFIENQTESPSELYEREMKLLSKRKPVDKKIEMEAKQKTLDNAYHLESSIVSLCDSDDENNNNKCDESPILKNILNNFFSGKNKISNLSLPEYSEMLFKSLTKHVDTNSSEQNIPTRWSTFIKSLKAMDMSQRLLGGDIVISTKDQRINHIISTGGNFNPVELGLDSSARPLAVKRIPKKSSVCKIMKSLINPLLSLRNPHVLHYYVCDYEENELILATPLCEWNIGQYVLLMKQTSKSNLVNLSTMDIVRQFLSGLRFLHNFKDPVVHGNLKPSNIFVDLKGVVRVAEFGTHQALFKIIEAPDTSLIWFSRETYQTYKQTSVMECNRSSDIQVAGMLIHFILTGGKHPCGEGVYEIFKNLEKAIPKLNTQDPILIDLVTWMMLYDPNERPNIDQVLSHVFFWSSSRRWKFVLACAGITPHGASIELDINELHGTFDKQSKRENIKGNWVDIIRNKYPTLLISNEDTITGLLKFIKNYYDKQMQLELRDPDLSNCILTYFPALPLSLHRMIESTEWVHNNVFISYSLPDPLH